MKHSLLTFLTGTLLFAGSSFSAVAEEEQSSVPSNDATTTTTTSTMEQLSTPRGMPTWFDIPTQNLEKSKQFYTELFGWQYELSKVNNKDYWYVRSEQGGTVGGLYQLDKPAKTSPAHGIIVYFSVPNIDDIIAKASKMGSTTLIGKTMIAPEQGYFAIISDPDNNTLGLVANQ